MIALPARAQGLYTQASAIQEARPARDGGLLAIRIGLAWIFIYNGGGKLFGLFGGGGVHQASRFFGEVAHLHPAVFFTVVAGITEFFGAIAVGIGIFGRLASIGLIVDMVMAMVTVTWRNGIVSNAAGGGYQLNLALITMALAVALMGTGQLSLDKAAYRLWVNRSQPSRRP